MSDRSMQAAAPASPFESQRCTQRFRLCMSQLKEVCGALSWVKSELQLLTCLRKKDGYSTPEIARTSLKNKNALCVKVRFRLYDAPHS